MKFYDRDNELNSMALIQQQSLKNTQIKKYFLEYQGLSMEDM